MECPSCHQEVSGAFCNLCGATLAAATAGSPSAVPASSAASGLSPSSAAALSYLTILPPIIFLVIDPYKKIKLVKFHSLQSLTLFVALVATYISLAILSFITAFIAPTMSMLFLFLYFVAGIAFFGTWLFTMIKASKGEFFKLPFIGAFAAKQSGV